MSSEKWHKVKGVFDEALQLEPDERRRFLDETCDGDQELRTEVEPLLSSFGQADGFMDELAVAEVAEVIVDKNEKLVEGQTLSHYKILLQIGAGGMGRVYAAYDLRLGRKVAIKILCADFTRDKDLLKRFKREAYAASTLNHPNIITIHEIGSENKQHFIVTEFIEGETLRDCQSKALLDLRQILDICIQVASALAAAHGAGIVHRDIKAENIILRRDGIVKVIDFGLVKLIESKLPDPKFVDTDVSTQKIESTIFGTLLGTVAYMSPEQARGLKIDARSDIWSLGIVLYQLVSGKLPFAGETVSDCIASILKTELPPLAETPGVPAELETIVRKSLAKNRDDRYQTARDLLIDLENLRHDLKFQSALERSAPPQVEDIKANSNKNELIGIINHRSNENQTSASRQIPLIDKHLSKRIKPHKLGFGLIFGALIFCFIFFSGTSYFSTRGNVSSIAVLPFVNAGTDSNTEYLSDGIAESIIKNLSQLEGVKVIARNSSFKYKGKETEPQEVAEALGVQTIVTGKIVPLGDQLIVSVELINARDKTEIWGEQYNRKPADLFQLQSEISKEIVGKLSSHLTGAPEKKLRKTDAVNPEAYELLLKGQFYNRKGGKENQKKAVEYFNQAIATDPNYAAAYAELAMASIILVHNSQLDPKEFQPKAEAAARKALELDENLADAHYAMAQIKRSSWEWIEAEREYKRALELNPNFARARSGYSFYLCFMKRFDEAFAENKRAKELDPLSIGNRTDKAYIHYVARQYEQAIAELENALELDQNFATAHVYLGYVYAAKGMHQEAITAYQKAIELTGETSGRLIHLGQAYAKSGAREKARFILKRLETDGGYVSSGELAILYNSLGEREQAFSLLEKAYAIHDIQLQNLGVVPSYDSLRDDRRFKDLLGRIGLTSK